MSEKIEAASERNRTIYWDQTGPLVQFDGQFLRIEDLNPQVKTRWRMSRWEMVVFGLKAAWAGLFA